MNGNPGGVQRGYSSPPHTTDILVSVADGFASGGAGFIWEGLPRFNRGDSGGTSAPYHLQYGGGYSGLKLVRGDGR